MTVDPDLVELAEADVAAGRARSVSAYVNEALRDKQRRQARARELLAAMVNEHRLADPEAFAASRSRAEAMVAGRLAQQEARQAGRQDAADGGSGAAA